MKRPDLCFGWSARSLWCILDRLCGCRWRRICDAHDEAIWRMFPDTGEQ